MGKGSGGLTLALESIHASQLSLLLRSALCMILDPGLVHYCVIQSIIETWRQSAHNSLEY